MSDFKLSPEEEQRHVHEAERTTDAYRLRRSRRSQVWRWTVETPDGFRYVFFICCGAIRACRRRARRTGLTTIAVQMDATR